MLSPRIRGKGGRRCPGRDGGRGKQLKAPPWQKQAMHAVEQFDKHVLEVVEISFRISGSLSAAETVYRIDQHAAKLRFPYQIELVDSGYKCFDFVVRVPSSFTASLNAIIAELKGL